MQKASDRFRPSEQLLSLLLVLGKNAHHSYHCAVQINGCAYFGGFTAFITGETL